MTLIALLLFSLAFATTSDGNCTQANEKFFMYFESQNSGGGIDLAHDSAALVRTNHAWQIFVGISD